MKRAVVIVGMLLAACSKKEPAKQVPSVGSGSAVVAPVGSGSGSGSAAVGSGSAAVGSGSAAVGSGSAATGSADGSAATGSADGSAVTVVFKDLDHDAQVDYMKTKVQPAMKVAFQGFDKGEFAKFNCKSCHGKDADARKWEMPNPGLPKLNFADLESTTDEDEKRAIEFMSKITHQMADLLGEPERTELNPDGFGCLDCHLEEK